MSCAQPDGVSDNLAHQSSTADSTDPQAIPVLAVRDEELTALIEETVQLINQQPHQAEHRSLLAMIYDANGFDLVAQELYRQSLTLDSTEFDTHYLLARRLYLDGLLSEAIAQAQVATTLRDDYPPLFLRLGSMNLDAGNYALARLNFEKAQMLNAGPAASAGRARVMLKQGETTQAISLLSDLMYDSKHPVIYRLLSQALRQEGNVARSHSLIDLTKGTKSIWFNDPIEQHMLSFAVGVRQKVAQAQAHLSNGDSGKALEVLRPLAETHPDDYTVHYHLGLSLLRSGQSSEALTHLLKSINLESVHYPSHLLTAAIYQQLEDNINAQEHLLQVVTIFPKLQIAHQELAFVQLRLGLQDKALASLLRAIELDSTSANVHYYTGVILGERDQCEEAIPHFLNTLNLDASHRRAHIGLATCYQLLGRGQVAAKHNQLALQLEQVERLDKP